MTVHDQADILEKNLPLFLNTNGGIPYELIVVDDSSTDDTPDVLKRFKADYPQLYTTFLPLSNVPYPSRTRLGLSLGAKATHSEWIVIADITRPPQTEEWLSTMASSIDNGNELVLFYINKTQVIQSFETVEEAEPIIRKAERKSKRQRGHTGRMLFYRRGLYNVMMVKRTRIHDVIKYFDNKIGIKELMELRADILWNNLFLK